MSGRIQATTDAPNQNHDHGFDAIEPGDDARFDIERGSPDSIYGSVERVERFDAGDVKLAIVDTRGHGLVRMDWHGAVSLVDGGDVIGNHTGDALRLST